MPRLQPLPRPPVARPPPPPPPPTTLQRPPLPLLQEATAHLAQALRPPQLQLPDLRAARGPLPLRVLLLPVRSFIFSIAEKKDVFARQLRDQLIHSSLPQCPCTAYEQDLDEAINPANRRTRSLNESQVFIVPFSWLAPTRGRNIVMHSILPCPRSSRSALHRSQAAAGWCCICCWRYCCRRGCSRCVPMMENALFPTLTLDPAGTMCM